MNRFNLKKISLVTSLVLVASVFVGCNSSIKDDNGGQGEITVSSTTTIVKKEGESIKANLGEETVNEDIGITIKNIYKMDLEDDEYTNLAVYVQITNKSKETNDYSAIVNFGVREQGATTDNVDLLGLSNSYLYIKRNTNFNRLNGAVAPNTMLDGLVTIRVPKDFQEATFVFYPNVSTSTGEVTLTFTPDDLEDLPLSE